MKLLSLMTKLELLKYIQKLTHMIKSLQEENKHLLLMQGELKAIAEKTGSEKAILYRTTIKLEEECNKLSSSLTSLKVINNEKKHKT